MDDHACTGRKCELAQNRLQVRKLRPEKHKNGYVIYLTHLLCEAVNQNDKPRSNAQGLRAGR